MQSFLEQYGPLMGLIGLVAGVVGLMVALVAQKRISQAQKRWEKVLQGTDSASLEAVLQDHVDRVMGLSGRIDAATERISVLESKMVGCKRFIGVVRYDAFPDMGGSQSFCLAVYDENGDGAVVTSQVGRNDCRVYVKEITGGRAERELSQEERQAIEAAVVKKGMAAARF